LRNCAQVKDAEANWKDREEEEERISCLPWRFATIASPRGDEKLTLEEEEEEDEEWWRHRVPLHLCGNDATMIVVLAHVNPSVLQEQLPWDLSQSMTRRIRDYSTLENQRSLRECKNWLEWITTILVEKFSEMVCCSSSLAIDFFIFLFFWGTTTPRKKPQRTIENPWWAETHNTENVVGLGAKKLLGEENRRERLIRQPRVSTVNKNKEYWSWSISWIEERERERERAKGV
jgi:hypothetical protein